MSRPYLLNHLLEGAAEEHPALPAVVDGNRVLTYSELDGAANRLAHLLISAGVEPGDRVGLYLDKSLEAVVGIHAVHKAGAAYVPLDSRAPVGRIGYMASDCGIRHLISASKQSPRWPELIAHGAPVDTIVVLDADTVPSSPDGVTVLTRSHVEDRPPSRPSLSRIDQDLAYILYTSGSTGAPKGVMLSHRNALGFVLWAKEEVALTSRDRLSSHAPFHFDLSVFDLFAAAAAGATVTLVPSTTSVFPVEVARFIDRHAISVWYSVPSILSLLYQHAELPTGALPSLRTVIFAGEVFPSKYLHGLMTLLPHVDFHNWYGPTETNVCTAYRVAEPPQPDGPDIPIGRAIDNVETAVIGDSGRPVPHGEEGELVVRGATVMQGYWGDADKTLTRLVAGLLDGTPDPVYRTGDLVVEQPDGNYRFLGRRDHQIKSRGYRIELGEIETALYAHPDVVECAVVAVPDEVVSNRIKAYVVTRGASDAGRLVAWCGERVPKYMIPEEFQFASSLPKTSTGKIDRRAL